MRVTSIPTFAATASIPEYVFGAAQQEITYPGLSQCISITGYGVGRLVGTHISPGSTVDEIDAHFSLLRDASTNCQPTWYIAGQFTKHFATAKAVMNTWDKFRKTVRTKLGDASAYYVFDTSKLTEEAGWSFGLDIRATLVDGAPKFCFAKFGGRKDKPFKNLALFYFNRL